MNIFEGEMYAYNYFPTHIAETYLKDFNNINNNIIPKLYNLKKETSQKIVRSNTGGWHSPDDLNYRPEFRNIFNAIMEAVNAFTKQFEYDDDFFDLEIKNMWSIINQKYHFNELHSHSNSLWSGVYYVKAPQNCGKINLYDPRPQAHCVHHFTKTKEMSPLNFTKISFEPKDGKCLIFPGWLQHNVEPNMSDEDRIIISFNIDQSKKII